MVWTNAVNNWQAVIRQCATLSLVVGALGCSDAGPDEEVRLMAGAELVVDRETCPGCTIEFEVVARLGSIADPAGFREDIGGHECMVSPLSTGEFLVSGLIGGSQIFVYNQRGELDRTIGRRGQGPGEFGEQIRVAVGPGDTIFAMDDTFGRVQVLTPEGAFVRSFLAPTSGRSFARLSTGDFVFFKSPSHESEPLFVHIDSLGEYVGHFGRGRMDEPAMEFWRIDVARDGNLWAGSVWEYAVEKWMPNDSTFQRVRRDVTWFPPMRPGDVYQGSIGDAPPRPLFSHVWEDTDERLWVYSWVPDEHWEAGIPLRPRYEWERRSFDTMIEVIDLSTGTVLASRRYDGRLGQMCDSDLVYTLVQADEMTVQLHIMQPQLLDVDN